MTPLQTAIHLIDKGLWPIPLWGLGETIPGPEPKVSKGKEPIGASWGLYRPTVDSLRAIYHDYPGAGLGILLGPHGGVVDVEVDESGIGEETLAQLMGGEIVETRGWDSRRGPHRLYRWDDRCVILDDRGKPRNKISGEIIPGLEIRFGADVQLQSACPPTPGEDGKPRVWRKVRDLARLPDLFFENLDDRIRLSMRRRVAITGPRIVPSGDVERRAVAYLDRCPPAVSGNNGHDTTFATALKVGPGFDLPKEMAFRLLRDHYSPRCDPPWSDKEIWHKVDDSYDFSERGWLLNAEHATAVPRFSGNGYARECVTTIDTSISDEDLGLIDYDPNKMTNVKWVIKNVICEGGMTLVAGDGDRGKSQVAISIAAAVTGGPPFPFADAIEVPGKVLIMAAEDGFDDMVFPRMNAAGAVPGMFKGIRPSVLKTDKDGRIQVMPRSFQDLDWWDMMLDRFSGVRLIVADPIPSFLGRGVNDNANGEVRSIMETFCTHIRKNGIGLLGVVHLNKAVDSRTPLHRILGSVAYPNLARVNFIACEDQDDPERYLLTNPKVSGAPKSEKFTRGYSIVSKTILRPGDGEEIRTSCIAWESSPDSMTANQAMQAERTSARRSGPPPAKATKLAEWLFDYLKEAGQPVQHGVVFDAAGAVGLIGVKNENNRWSGGTAMYRAEELIPILPPPRDGAEIEKYEMPTEFGYTRKYWKLNLPGGSEPAQLMDPWET